jgi:hypothetical protein
MVGPWVIYEFPGIRRLPYPGLASLRPEIAKQLDFGGAVAAAHRLLVGH